MRTTEPIKNGGGKKKKNQGKMGKTGSFPVGRTQGPSTKRANTNKKNIKRHSQKARDFKPKKG